MPQLMTIPFFLMRNTRVPKRNIERTFLPCNFKLSRSLEFKYAEILTSQLRFSKKNRSFFYNTQTGKYAFRKDSMPKMTCFVKFSMDSFKLMLIYSGTYRKRGYEHNESLSDPYEPYPTASDRSLHQHVNKFLHFFAHLQL